MRQIEKEKKWNWYIMSLSYSNGHQVKLMVEKGVKVLGIDDCLDKFIVLSSIKHDNLFLGGLLSGYALIRCKMTAQLYYLLVAIPQVYGLLESPNRKKNNTYVSIDNAIARISDEEVYKLIETCLVREKKGVESGDSVKVKEGPFAGYKADVLAVSGKKAQIEVETMGRIVKVTIEVENLERLKR